MDESTTVSRKSCLVLHMRTAWLGGEEDCVSFPPDLVELNSLTARHIYDATIDPLAKHGFDEFYLGKHLIGACSDGASVMLEKNTGVLTQLKTKFPNIISVTLSMPLPGASWCDTAKACTHVNARQATQYPQS